MITDADGTRHSTAVRKEQDGTYSANVWFGARFPTVVRRYYYSSRKAAKTADISDAIGKNHRVR